MKLNNQNLRPNLRFILSAMLIFLINIDVFTSDNQYKFTRLDISNGLSHNQVTYITKDRRGFIWVSTSAGLNRFDGYTFKIFRHEPSDPNSIADNAIIMTKEDFEGKMWIKTRNSCCIYDPITEKFSIDHPLFHKNDEIKSWTVSNFFLDRENNFWLVVDRAGLFKYSAKEDKLIKVPCNSIDTSAISNTDITDIAQDSKGFIWIVDRYGLVQKLSPNSCKVVYRFHGLFNILRGKVLYFTLFIDKDDDLWLTTTNDASGMYYINNSNGKLLHLCTYEGKPRTNNNILTCVTQDDNGLIWAGTDHGGINIINKKDLSVQYVTNDPDDDKSIGQNSITSLYKDNSGIIWIGTYKKGVNYYHENIFKFRLSKRMPSNPRGLGFDDIDCFREDNKGNIWIGTNGGGLIYYDRKKETYSNYRHDESNPYSLNNDIIVCLCLDENKVLWAGTYFGGLNCFDGTKFTHFMHNPDDSTSIADNRIYSIHEDTHGNIWIGTLGEGLDLFNKKKKTFRHYRSFAKNSVQSGYIMAIAEDKEENIWFGTSNGVDKLEKKSGRFIHFEHDPNNIHSLSANIVTSILADSRGLIWVGTNDGLNVYLKSKKSFKTFRKENGLPDNIIVSFVEDNNGNIWASTLNGIFNLIVTTGKTVDEITVKCVNYDESDGLQGREFNANSSYKDKSGQLFFGGANGFNAFYPNEIKLNESKPEISFTNFQIFNKNINTGDTINSRVLLKKSILVSNEFTLKYKENMFSIDFVALNYIHPEKNLYSYMLEGFDKNWILTDSKHRKATYTNLDPGSYIFKVKASNNDNTWNENAKSIKIKILPPWWKAPFAYITYILLFIAALFYFRQRVLGRERMNQKIQNERLEAQRRQELDLVKIKFFTNISHELRTPLTLILTPIEKILKHTTDIDQKRQIQLIYRNARRLLNLVNQLLDFRKMEVQEFRLIPTLGDIVEFVKEASWSFIDLSEKKEINLEFHSNVGSLQVFFDQDKLEKILFNLLSNAFKFTPVKGNVGVGLSVIEDSENDDREQVLAEIKITDTGIGIPKEKQELIFERFFQNNIPSSIINQGTGIGLSIVKEFVRLHGGTIQVESEPDKGSCFTVILPLQKGKHLHPVEKNQIKETLAIDLSLHEADLEPPLPETDNKKSVLLLIDDNEDFRFYLKDNLKEHFRIIEAANGKEGWRQALSHIPDLIVSDVMMPEVNGIELNKKIKTDPRTSHIPIILLTAHTSPDQKIEGYEAGADDYITKPFNYELLQSRIKNLILQRKKLQKIFHKQIEIQPHEITVTSLDEKLISKALELVEKNISNADFSVEELSRELGMSRVNLYKKLLSITGKTPIEFIRVIRLKRAAQLLGKSQLSVSEIAYNVGFNNPKYFSKYFKEEFDMLPSDYIAQKKKENGSV
jgi:signal transduction histidine kinase/ligand-binding sensor domain-containing protein/DNA-binding response OmpR family regulator